MTFISGPFGETIQEEEEGEVGVNGGVDAKPHVKSSLRHSKKELSSKPSTPKKIERPRSSGKAASVKNGKSPAAPAKVRRITAGAFLIGCRIVIQTSRSLLIGCQVVIQQSGAALIGYQIVIQTSMAECNAVGNFQGGDSRRDVAP